MPPNPPVAGQPGGNPNAPTPEQVTLAYSLVEKMIANGDAWASTTSPELKAFFANDNLETSKRLQAIIGRETYDRQ